MENTHTDTLLFRDFLEFRHDGTYVNLPRGMDWQLSVILLEEGRSEFSEETQQKGLSKSDYFNKNYLNILQITILKLIIIMIKTGTAIHRFLSQFSKILKSFNVKKKTSEGMFS